MVLKIYINICFLIIAFFQPSLLLNQSSIEDAEVSFLSAPFAHISPLFIIFMLLEVSNIELGASLVAQW